MFVCMFHHNSRTPEPIAPKLGIRIPQLREGVIGWLAQTGRDPEKGGRGQKTNVWPDLHQTAHTYSIT